MKLLTTSAAACALALAGQALAADIRATTEDGTAVILHDNGTWSYEGELDQQTLEDRLSSAIFEYWDTALLRNAEGEVCVKTPESCANLYFRVDDVTIIDTRVDGSEAQVPAQVSLTVLQTPSEIAATPGSPLEFLRSTLGFETEMSIGPHSGTTTFQLQNEAGEWRVTGVALQP